MTLPTTAYYQNHLAGLHRLLVQHEIALMHLSGKDLRFDGTNLTANDNFPLPSGAELSTLEFAHLFSVFNNSRVHMQAEKSLSMDDAPPGMYFTVINTRLIQGQHKNKAGLYQEQLGESGLHIDGLHIDHFFLNEQVAPARLGTIAFALCAITAYLANLGKISLIAAGGVGFNPKHIGYKVWPRLGFDAPLLAGEVQNEPELQHCATVQHVLAIKPQWWDQHGSQRLMTFDLMDDSTSWKKLLSYLTEKVC